MRDLGPVHLATISRIFSSTVIREMARKGRSPLLAKLARDSRLWESIPKSAPVSVLFDSAFSLLKREGFRDEYIYKTAIAHNVLLGIHSLKTASMLNEFRVGDCKADVAILNGTSTAYEIKSERDTLSRLERQVAAYARVFALVYVITAEEYVDSVSKLIPLDVGILRLNSRLQITTVRDAAERLDRISPTAVFDCLRTEEARLILELFGVSTPALPNTRLRGALAERFMQIDGKQAHHGMVQVLKRTRNLLPLSELISELPRSLYSAALSVPLRRADHARLVAAVRTPLEIALTWV